MLVSTMRTALRFTNTAFDLEIQDNIDTALLDMSRVGVDITKDDKLTDKCIDLYCKWQFDYRERARISTRLIAS